MNILALFGALQGFLIALFMFFKDGNRLANRSAALSTFFSVVQMLLVLNFAQLKGSHGLLNLKFYVWANALLIPPFFFFYVKFITEESPRVRWKDGLHFIPFLFVLLLTGPYYLLNFADKTAFAGSEAPAFILYSKIAELSHATSIFTYGLIGFWVVRKFQKRIRDEFSNLDQKQMKWLSNLSILFSIIGLTGLAGTFKWFVAVSQGGKPETLNLESAHLTFVVIGIVFYVIAYNFMTQPEVFGYRYKKQGIEAEPEIETPPASSKYVRSGLDPAEIEFIAARLVAFMGEQKPYLMPDLNAEELAEGVRITKHTLSQVLNGHFQKNFFDFINDYRIEDAKKRLVDPEFANLTIRGIALDAGFKSKSTFYALFKEYTGISPTEYQARYAHTPGTES